MNKTIHELEELTQAEATDELIVFDVSDAKSKKVKVQNLVGGYSQSETFTGQYWNDEKPIYRRVFIYQNVSAPTGTFTNIDSNFPISTTLIKKMELSAYNSQNNVYLNINDYYLVGTALHILQNVTSLTLDNVTVIVEYTKS